VEDNVDLNLATQDDGQGNVGANDNNNGGSGDGSQQQQYFLDINERTRYKTADDAKRGYSQLQEKVTSFSPIERTLKQYYGDKFTPEVLSAHLADYVRRLEADSAKEAEEAKAKLSKDDAARFEGKSAEEIKQIRAAEKWFQSEAERLGYVSKDALKKLEDKLAKIENAPVEQSKSANDAMTSAGTAELQKWLGESKVVLNDTEMARLGKRIVAYIDGDDELTQKWVDAAQSRNKAECFALIREAANFALPLVKSGAKLIDPAATQRSAVATKTKLIATTPKPLPKPGAGKEVQVEPPPPRPTQRGLRKPNLTQAAMALMEEMEAQG